MPPNIDKDSIKQLFPDSNSYNITIYKDNRFLDWEHTDVLFDYNLIPGQQGLYMEITIKENENNIFNMKWAIFDNVAYIHWIRIEDKYRQQGISRNIRRKVIKWIFSNDCVEIFTIPSTVAGESLARSQGFTKTEIQPDDEQFTVYSLNSDKVF